jgi:hypothetical protein
MPKLRSIILQIYGLALYLYPAEFEAHNSAEMLRCAREMLAESPAPLRSAHILAIDLLQSLATEYLTVTTTLKAIPQLALVLILTTFIAGTAYFVSQQVLRTSANDPQIQLAEDGARRIDAGEELAHIVPAFTVPMESSLAPFVIAYDDAGRPVASSATLDGTTPTYPQGVLDYVRTHGEDRVTWQPRRGVRIASVVTRSAHGFVVAGRNMREVEERIYITFKLAFMGWIFANVSLCGLWLAMQWLGRTKIPLPRPS